MQSSVHTASVVSVIFVFIICNWTFGMVDLASSDYINEGCIASVQLPLLAVWLTIKQL